MKRPKIHEQEAGDSPMYLATISGLTLAVTVWPSENRTLFYASEVLNEFPHILFRLLFAKHANEQFPVFCKETLVKFYLKNCWKIDQLPELLYIVN